MLYNFMRSGKTQDVLVAVISFGSLGDWDQTEHAKCTWQHRWFLLR